MTHSNNPTPFLDREGHACHHETTMRYSLFHKRMKTPPLVEGEKKSANQKVERLKAGRLATMAIALTRSLIEQFGPRASGSEASHLAAGEIERSLSPFCDRTEQGEVTLDPTFHSMPLAVMAYLYPFLVLLLPFRLSFLSLLLFVLYMAYLVTTLYYYKPVVRNTRKSVKGINVHGVIEPEGEVEQTIIFTSHHDSAPLFRHNRLDRFSYLLTVGVPILLFLLAGLLSLILLFSKPSLGVWIITAVMLALTPRFLPLIRFYDEKASPGAGDNLNSTSVIIQLARYFNWKRAGEGGLESTRLVFCSFDGEEIGLQGSKAWYERNTELTEGAIVLNFDSIYWADCLTFLERDVNGTQPLSEPLARRCTAIARSMGWSAKSESIPRLAGATDAASASRAGLAATTLTAVAWDDRSKASVYHTDADTVDAIEVQAVERALSIAIRLVELADSHTLWEESEEAASRVEEGAPTLSFSKLTTW